MSNTDVFVLEPFPSISNPCVSVQTLDCKHVHVEIQCQDKAWDYRVTLDSDHYGSICTAAHAQACEDEAFLSWVVYCEEQPQQGIRIYPADAPPNNENCTVLDAALFYYDKQAKANEVFLRLRVDTSPIWLSHPALAAPIYLSRESPEFRVALPSSQLSFTFTTFPVTRGCRPWTRTLYVDAPAPRDKRATTDGQRYAIGVFYFASCVIYFLASQRLGPTLLFCFFTVMASLVLQVSVFNGIFFLAFLLAIPLGVSLAIFKWAKGGSRKLRIPDFTSVSQSSIVLVTFAVVQIIVAYWGKREID